MRSSLYINRAQCGAKFSNNQRGFTLVEMAIVLVIIGLLLGGVLKGQELVVQARVKSIINDFNQTTAAYYTYFDRYRRFPGDDSSAKTRWSVTTNGDGNGLVQTGTTAAVYTTGTENKNLWWHLRLAGIIGGATDATNGILLPINSVGGVTGIQEGGFGMTETVICTDSIPRNLAELIDYAIDDGKADLGIVRGAVGTSGTLGTLGTSSATATGYETAGIYVVCRKL
jgi:prepilin-type N-terminal cleavage/methylation domain-containing protein